MGMRSAWRPAPRPRRLYEGRDRFGTWALRRAFARRGCVERQVDKWRGSQFGGEAGQAQAVRRCLGGASAYRCGYRFRPWCRASNGGMPPGYLAWPQTRQPDGEDETSPREPWLRRLVQRRRPAPVLARASSSRMTPREPICIATRRPVGEGAASERVPQGHGGLYEGGDGLWLWRRHPTTARGRDVRRRIHDRRRRQHGGEPAPPGYIRESLRRRLVRKRRPLRPAAGHPTLDLRRNSAWRASGNRGGLGVGSVISIVSCHFATVRYCDSGGGCMPGDQGANRILPC